MYLIDANIFLEVELGQKNGLDSKKLLKKFEKGELTGYITDFHVDSIVIVMENYRKNGEDIATFLSSLLKYRGISVIATSLYTKICAAGIMENFHLDFDDAIVCQCMIENSLTKLVSYDSHFDNVDFVERLTPDKLI